MTICESSSAIRRFSLFSLATCRPLRNPQISITLFVLWLNFPAERWTIAPLLLHMIAPYRASPRFPSEAPSKLFLWYPNCGASQWEGLILEVLLGRGDEKEGERWSYQALRMMSSLVEQIWSWSIHGSNFIVSFILEWILAQTSCHLKEEDLNILRFFSFQIC